MKSHDKLNIREEDGIIYEKIYDFEIAWPKMPNKRSISGYALRSSRQKFTKTQYPKSLFNPRRDVNKMIIYSVEETSWINKEFDRIVNGYWFYNNGTPTYITGCHYFELNYWKIDVGLKAYRDRDRRNHLVWQMCEDDPNCYGFIYMKHRREGATHRACCVNYLTALFYPGVMNAIQSKSGADASKVFRTKLVQSWRALKPFLQPIFEGTDNPKKELSFSQPADKAGKSNRSVKSSDALDSKILWGNTVYTTFDGDKLKFAHLDEVGKWIEEDAYKTWLVIKECLSLGNRIVGKCMLTSTVEDMAKGGGSNFKKIWDESNINQKSANGRTTSGLYRLFFPAYDGLEGYIDEYGYSMTTEAKAYLDAERDQKKKHGDAEGLSSFKRKYPYTESDALIAAGVNCEFNLEKLEATKEYIDNLPKNEKPYVIGNLKWENGMRDTRAVFYPDPYGKWKIAWRAEDESEMNNVIVCGHGTDQVPNSHETYDRHVYKPNNTEKFVLGVDPYDHDRTKTGKGSKGGGYVFKKHDILEADDDKNNIFAAQYLHRPPTAAVFYEDMILTCMWFGCQLLFEDQKQRIKNYFQERKYQNFLMVSPLTEKKKKEKGQRIDKIVDVGQSASTEVTQQIAEHWEVYIEDNWEKIPFEELIDDLIQFDPFKTEKSDATMASGYALIASKKYIKKRNTVKKDIKDLFPMYTHQGTQAKIVT